MLNTQNVSVAVDLSSTDDKVLRYIQFLADKLNIKRLNLIHVIPSLLSPGNADWEMHEILGPGYNLKGKIKDQLLTKTEFLFQKEIFTEVEIVEGNPFREMIIAAENLDSNLVVVGRKEKSEGSGITAQRIARNFSGNVLFVPAKAPLKINRISVPLDFSENSARALKEALYLSKEIKNCSVRCIHIVNTAPANYYLDLKTRNQLDHQFLQSAKMAWDVFIEKNDFKKKEVPIDFIQKTNENSSKILSNYFEDQKSDLIVMGAKGHTAFENFLYGSVTENFVDSFHSCPVMIVR
ncbi:MAG: universal stress protein [Saprospiraceae bacterium]